jgi:hypothetical protein
VDWTKSRRVQRRFDYVIRRDFVQAVQTAGPKSSAPLRGGLWPGGLHRLDKVPADDRVNCKCQSGKKQNSKSFKWFFLLKIKNF